MIGKLKGLIDSIGEDEAVIDVNGVGYLVQAGGRTLSKLEIGAEASLHIETYVREDQFKLFGFLSEGERAWFVRLQSVQGVGAKHALALLDALGPGRGLKARPRSATLRPSSAPRASARSLLNASPPS